MIRNIRGISAAEVLIPGFAIASLLVMFFNLPGPVMDWLLSFNIALSVLIFLTTFFIRRPLDFSVFPTLLLATTLFRLALNIGTTRLILTRADTSGTLAAGKVVRAFSEFVSADSLVVGFVIFAIFIVIQFVVITKGATRISEVAARFTLDALPGRQMAIDADLNAGLIDSDTARQKREELTDLSDFFGAMDGAGKFVRGDAIAGLIIIAVNVIGGVLIGTLQHGQPLVQTLATYTTLTVGDGLVSQVPALLISMATGVLVSRSSREGNLSKGMLRQLVCSPMAFALGGVFLLSLVFTGLPVLPLLTLAAGCFTLAYFQSLRRREQQREQQARAAEEQKRRGTGTEQSEDHLRVDPLELLLGVGLVPLVQSDRDGTITPQRFTRIRNDLADEWGILLPSVRIRDRLDLDENRFRVLIDGQCVAEGTVWPSMYLAIDQGRTEARLAGIRTTDPLGGGAAAYWIEEKERDNAEIFGFEILSPADALLRMFRGIVVAHADELLTRDMLARLIDGLRKSAPAVVDDLGSDTLQPTTILSVLRLLLREYVSIRPLGTIFETLADLARRTKNPQRLAEGVRLRLSRMITDRLLDLDGRLRVIQLDPVWEEMIRQRMVTEEDTLRVELDPGQAEEFISELRSMFASLADDSQPVALLVSSAVRAAVRHLTAAQWPTVAVLAHDEIPRRIQLVPEGVIHCRKVAA